MRHPGPAAGSGRPGRRIGDCTDAACQDACITAACPAAVVQMMAVDTCVETNCATECADLSAPGCASCLTTYCITEFNACTSGTCS